MKKHLNILFTLLCGLLCVGLYHPVILSAETIMLQSGKKVSGKIIEEDDKKVIIEMASGIQLSIKKELIRDEQEAVDIPKQEVESAINIIDAKTDVSAEDLRVNFEERKQVMAFLNKTSHIDDELKKILSAKNMKFDKFQEGDNKEKARGIINKRIATIEKAIKDLQDITPPVGGRDFYDMLNQFYYSMVGAEDAVLLALISEEKEKSHKAIEETLKLADQADQELKKLLKDFNIIDVQLAERLREQEAKNKEAFKKNKKEYEARMVKIKKNKMKQEQLRQRRDFLRYLNYF